MDAILVYTVTAAFIGIFVYFGFGALRVHQGRVRPAPLLQRASIAVIFVLNGWQAIEWLRTDHFAAADARFIAVWVQLLCSFGISAVMITQGWLVHEP